MKRSERHHLKENELSGILGGAASTVARNSRAVGVASAVLLVVALAVGGYWAWQVRAESRARTALGEAMMVVQSQVEAPAPPAAGGTPVQRAGTYPTLTARTEAALTRLMEVANAYPSADSGVAARYYGAAGLSLLGRLPEAITQFQEVVDRAGRDSFYGRMAQLGLVDAHVQAKQYDQAIAISQEVVNSNDERLPRDAVLMQLARVYLAAGKTDEAKKTLDQVVKEFPDSTYGEEARQELTNMTTKAG